MISAAQSLKNFRINKTATETLAKLAKDPTQTVAVATAVLRSILLRTNAMLKADDGLSYEIKSKNLGAGVHRVSLTPVE